MAIYRLAIDPNQVTGTHASGFVQLITEASIPASHPIWGVAVNGGGDLRSWSNALGTNSLPLEVISFDTIAKTCILWVRHTEQVDNVVGGELWIEATGSGAQPPVTDPAGRNAVWQDYTRKYSLGGATDSSGNSDLSIFGSGTAPAQEPAKIGDGSRFDGQIYSANPVDVSSSFTLSCWVNPDNITNGGTSQRVVGSTGSRLQFLIYTNTSGLIRGAVSGSSGSVFLDGGLVSTSQYTQITMTKDGGNTALFINGALADSQVDSFGTIPQGESFGVGGTLSGSSVVEPIAGVVDDVYYTEAAKSADYIATEYSNQSDPASFAQLEVPEPSEGVESSVSLSLDSLGFAATSTVTLPTPVSAASLQLDGLSFAVASSVTLPTPVSSATLQLEPLGFDVAASATQSTPVASVGFSIGELGFDAESAVTLPDVSSSVTMSLGELRFTAVVGEVVASKKYTFSLTPRKLSGALTTRKI